MPIPGPVTPTAGDESDVSIFTTGVATKDIAATRDVNATVVTTGGSADFEYRAFDISTPYDPYNTNFMPSKVITADYVVDDSPLVILVDATAGNITITLQSPQFAEGKTVIIMRLDNTASRTITVTTVAGANVRISSTRSMNLNTQYNALVFTAVNDPTYPIWVGR
jgi:hypothetical protein